MNLTHEQQAVAKAEIIKYRYVWEHCENYGVKHHDLDLWERVGIEYDFASESNIIVLGCGDGSLVKYLHQQDYNSFGIDIYEHPSWNGDSMFKKHALWNALPKSKDNKKWNFAICADVMEHIPEILLPVVLKNINESCNNVLFQIAKMESNFGGYDLHPIKEDAGWWIEMMNVHMDGRSTIINDGAPAGRFVIDWLTSKLIGG